MASMILHAEKIRLNQLVPYGLPLKSDPNGLRRTIIVKYHFWSFGTSYHNSKLTLTSLRFIIRVSDVLTAVSTKPSRPAIAFKNDSVGKIPESNELSFRIFS